MKRRAPFIAALIVLVSARASLRARTIELSDLDADRIAVIGPEAPRMSWAASEIAPGHFVTDSLALRRRAALLIRVPLDKIPPNCRVTKAQWVLSMGASSVPEPQLYVWRILGDWGAGACYQFRTTRPKPVEWTTAGARGTASDRAQRPTDVVPCKVGADILLNVTADVELWYSGAAPNSGWMFCVEDDIQLKLNAPAYTTRGTWKLRITYEPK